MAGKEGLRKPEGGYQDQLMMMMMMIQVHERLSDDNNLDDPSIRKSVLLYEEGGLLGELLLGVDVVANVAELLLHDPGGKGRCWLL